MKVRIYKNSLRIRLDDDDLTQLIENGSVTEKLRFGAAEDACLVYSVETRDTPEGASAELRAGHIRIFIRPAGARNLADETEVAIEATQGTDGPPDLQILVEKEFLP